MKVDYVEETTVRKALTFEIEADIVEKEIATRAERYARTAKVPGFRPGKVPTAVIRKRYKGQVMEEVVEALVNRYVHEELEGRGLRPLAPPKVTDLKIDENQPLTFRAVFETLPLLDMPDYKGLRATVRKTKVTDEDVTTELERLREESARYEAVEGRASQEGDTALVDITWTPVDGSPGGRDERAALEVGAATNPPELNAVLVGLGAGDTRSVTFTYGEEAPSKALAGKEVTHDVVVKAIKKKIVPVLDDEFAKDLGEYDTLEQLRDAVRSQLVAVDERRIDREVKESLMAELLQKASFEVPEALIDRHMSARTENAIRTLAYQGIDPRKVGVDWKDYRENQREEATKAAKSDILLDEIARREGVEALDGEIDGEVERMARRLKKPKEAVRQQMEKEGDIAQLAGRIREEKTLDLLKANARLDNE